MQHNFFHPLLSLPFAIIRKLTSSVTRKETNASSIREDQINPSLTAKKHRNKQHEGLMKKRGNTEARSRKYCYSEKTRSSTYLFLCMCVGDRSGVRACACAHVALINQHATRRHIVIRGVLLHQIFRHHLLNGTIFGKTLLIIKVCLDFLYNFYLKEFLF